MASHDEPPRGASVCHGLVCRATGRHGIPGSPTTRQGGTETRCHGAARRAMATRGGAD